MVTEFFKGVDISPLKYCLFKIDDEQKYVYLMYDVEIALRITFVYLMIF